MKKAVLVSSILPFPVNAAKKVTVSGILKYLCERYGAEHVTYILVGESGSEDSLGKSMMPCRLLTLEKPGITEQLWNILWFVLIKRAKSIQESMLYSVALGRELRADITRIDPDLVVCDTLRVGQFFETTQRSKGRYILHMDDLFSVRYQKMIEALRRFPQARMNPLGGFARFVPSLFRSFVKVTFVQRWALGLEQKLIEKREQECVRWFDASLLVNEKEVASLRKKTGCPSIQPIKPLLQGTKEAVERAYKGEPAFVYLGDLAYPPNQLAITHFIRTQMDHIIERTPDVILRVIGRGESGELLRLAEKYEDAVSLEGFVDDLDAVLRTCCAMVIPLLSGSGVKLKTLEALSRGMPIVSTDFGVEGIPVTNAVDCIVENDIDRYPEIMADLLDTELNSEISQKARELFLENYSEERLFQEYDRIFGAKK